MTAGVYVEREGAIATVVLDRPDRLNALDLDDRRQLLTVVQRLERDADCRAVILTGTGQVFCAGGDIRSMSQNGEQARARLEVVNGIARTIAHSRLPYVGAVRGGGFGMGLALVAACDHVVSADDARFSASFVRIGLGPDSGASWSLARRVGPGRAKQMIMTGRPVGAEEALRAGLVDELVPVFDVTATAAERAAALAGAAPLALAGIKRIFAQERQDLDAVLGLEATLQLGLLASADFAEGRAAFLERRKPAFHGF
jgi:2-(1,2-epoxy-1,2-dihydrophenyl)acetyl-CoA isomerase